MMDAFEFCRELARMCKAYKHCDGCPIDKWEKETSCSCREISITEDCLRKKIDVVEKWSKEHPVKTMMQDFFERFPKALKADDGTPYPCPRDLGYSQHGGCGKFTSCYDCWNRPLEEE